MTSGKSRLNERGSYRSACLLKVSKTLRINNNRKPVIIPIVSNTELVDIGNLVRCLFHLQIKLPNFLSRSCQYGNPT